MQRALPGLEQRRREFRIRQQVFGDDAGAFAHRVAARLFLEGRTHLRATIAPTTKPIRPAASASCQGFACAKSSTLSRARRPCRGSSWPRRWRRPWHRCRISRRVRAGPASAPRASPDRYPWRCWRLDQVFEQCGKFIPSRPSRRPCLLSSSEVLLANDRVGASVARLSGTGDVSGPPRPFIPSNAKQAITSACLVRLKADQGRETHARVTDRPFDALVAPHMDMLLRVAHRLTRNRHDATGPGPGHLRGRL